MSKAIKKECQEHIVAQDGKSFWFPMLSEDNRPALTCMVDGGIKFVILNADGMNLTTKQTRAISEIKRTSGEEVLIAESLEDFKSMV